VWWGLCVERSDSGGVVRDPRRTLVEVNDLWRGARCGRRRRRKRINGTKAGANEEFNVAGLLFHYVNETVQFVLSGIVECSTGRRGGWASGG